ncbi:MAG: histidine kinase [Bacteroidetes bacterium]|nr:histidine kinase [Bacteroidota bacterium]
MNFPSKVLLLYAILLCRVNIPLASGQEVSPLFHHFATADGLPSSEVYISAQDRLGNLWFGTDRGLAKYNGYEFRTFTSKDGLADNTIFKLQEDAKGRMWALTYSGQLFYIEQDRVQAYAYNSVLLASIQNKVPTEFYVDSSGIVFVSVIGIGMIRIDSSGAASWNCKIENAYESNYYIDEVASGVLISSVYAPIIAKGPVKINYRNLTESEIYQVDVGFSNRLLSLSLHKKNVLFGFGRYLFEIRGDSCIRRQTFSGQILGLYKDKLKQVWLASENGVQVYQNDNFEKPAQRYLENYFVTSVLEDHEGGFWFTTLTDGVYYTPGYGIKGIKFREELLQKPVCVTSDNTSSVYAGYWSGVLLRLTGTVAQIVKTADKNLPDQPLVQVSTVPQDRKVYLSQSNPGFLLDNKFYSFRVKQPVGIKTSFIKRQNGDLYAAGSGSIFIYKDDTLSMVCNTDQRVNCISESMDKKLLIGSNRGLFYVDEKTCSTRLYHPSLNNVRIDDIDWFDGKLVLATKGKGVLILDGDRLIEVNEQKGLCSDLINKIIIEGNDIWCATNKGVGHIRMEQGEISSLTISNIYSSNGLLSDEINDITLLQDTVYVVANSGISFFNTHIDVVNHTQPLVHISELRVNNTRADYSEELEFRYGQNTIQIGFDGISYRSMGKMVYKYLLSNGKDTLSSLTTNREVEFLSLQPGNYTFHVSAMNTTGVWSEQSASLVFTILPPWWQTFWFLLIMCLLLIGALWFVYRNRLRKIQIQYEVERKQASLQLTAMRAQMNPHFIFNVMSSIRNFMQHNDMKSAEKYLTSFSKLVRYTLDNSQVQEVSVDDELNALRTYTELEMQRFENGFDFEIHSESGLDLHEYMLPSLLLQPFVENSIKHGISRIEGRGKIIIQLKRKGDEIFISIEDNGIGMEASSDWNKSNREAHISHGTSLTLERILAYNKAFNRNIQARIVNLNTPDGKVTGTRVEIEI